MSIIQGNAHTSAGGGYQIERSLRFNSADSAYLNRTPASAGNRTTWTWSGWVKRAALGTSQYILQARVSDNANDTDKVTFRFTVNNTLILQSQVTTFRETTAVYRDTSAWYHVVLTADTSNATANNRFRIYVNGVEQVFSTTTNPTSGLTTAVNSANAHWIGSEQGVASYLSAYITETYLIDGQALTPSSFGETDSATGVWKPKAYSGTYGTNGFYLKFADNSGTTSTTLGKDSSGNGNNWTPNNFSVTAGAGNDSMVDSPTSYGTDTGVGGEVRGNYCTLNPLNQTGLTFTNGNLNVTGTAPCGTKGTIGVSSGKWYWETVFTATAVVSSGIGLTNASNSTAVGVDTNSWGILSNGNKYYNGSSTSYGSAISLNDVIGIAVDLDAGKVWWSLNGTFQASGNPAAGTNEAFSSISGTIFPMVAAAGTNYTCNYNFGQRAFAYTAPSGFKALCTQNLPTPTIGATSTTQANDYFNTIIWTGDNSSTGTTRTQTGVGFQPDLVWIKNRSNAYFHNLYDAVRGSGSTKNLSSNTTGAEGDSGYAALYGYLSAFNSDGFQTTNGTDANPGVWVNQTSQTYVAWNWKANGAGSSNTAGTITSTVSANTTSGFSIVTYTGTGANATVGHGLGVAPSMVIVKCRSVSGNQWAVWQSALSGTEYLLLETTNAKATATTIWNSTIPSSTVFSVGTANATNQSTATFVAYCFAPVAGYSAFGSYTGNGSTDGVFVYTGFRPRFLLLKISSTTGDWVIYDTSRNTYNVMDLYLYPNSSAAEGGSGTPRVDALSNGFKLRNSGQDNTSSATYIYAAFAESPFKYALAR